VLPALDMSTEIDAGRVAMLPVVESA